MLDPNANLLCEGGDDSPSPTPFVPNEKLHDHATSDPLSGTARPMEPISPIDVAYAACLAVGEGRGFFRNWKEKLNELMLPTYRLFREVHDNPSQIARIACLSGIEPTKAARRNPALICLTIGAQPTTTDQRKLCSDWSTLLRCALAENTPVDKFIDFVERTSIRECKAIIGKQQRAARIAAGLTPRKPHVASLAAAEHNSAWAGGSPRLELRLHGADGTAGETVDLPASIHAAVLDALTSPGSQPERLKRIIESLQALAGEWAAGVPVTDSQPEAGEPASVEVITEAADD